MNSRATSDGWKLLDPRNHKKPFGSRFVPLFCSYDIGEWASYDLRKYIDTKFQVLQSNFVVLRLLDKKAPKKYLACGNHPHPSAIGLNLWQAKVLRSGRSVHSELARVDVAPISTDFEKEMWCSSLCQLPASENRLTLEFTDSRLVHVLYHSWALPTSVNGRPTTFANTSTQNSKFFSPFSLFFDSSTKKALKKHLACKNHSHRSGIGLNLWQEKVLRSGRSAPSEMARVDVAKVMTDFEKEVWRSSICQLPASENRLTLEFTDSRLVHVLYHSWALPTSVNGRPTTFANTSTQNSKFFSPFSLFFDSSTKKLWKSTLRAKTTHTVLGLA